MKNNPDVFRYGTEYQSDYYTIINNYVWKSLKWHRSAFNNDTVLFKQQTIFLIYAVYWRAITMLSKIVIEKWWEGHVRSRLAVFIFRCLRTRMIFAILLFSWNFQVSKKNEDVSLEYTHWKVFAMARLLSLFTNLLWERATVTILFLLLQRSKP